MTLTAWTIADLAELTDIALQTGHYCECCDIVLTQHEYCDGCVEQIVNWLSWADFAAEELWQIELDGLTYAENAAAEKGWY